MSSSEELTSSRSSNVSGQKKKEKKEKLSSESESSSDSEKEIEVKVEVNKSIDKKMEVENANEKDDLLKKDKKPITDRSESSKKLKKEASKKNVLNEGSIVEMIGLEWNIPRLITYYFVCLISAGILVFLSYWFPRLKSYGRKSKVPLSLASFVLLKGADNTWEELDIENLEVGITAESLDKETQSIIQPLIRNGKMRMFVYRNLRYLYDFDQQTFRRATFNFSLPFNELRKKYSNGIQNAMAGDAMYRAFGENLINLPIQSITDLVMNEVFHPFYIFQMFSCSLWWSEGYIYYPIAIVLMSTVSIVWTVYMSRKHLVQLRDLAKSECIVTVHRGGRSDEISSTKLVPGDLVEIEDDLSIPCDLVVVSGECVVNESMLTGESTPVLKYTIPLVDEVYAPNVHKKHTLFCGTKVVQVKPTTGTKQVLAIVVRTGFNTSKGQLFFSILFPKPIKFQFYSDSWKFLFVMVCIAIGAFIWSAVHLHGLGYGGGEIALSSLDLVTIAVPPALPLVLTIGIGFAVARLKKREIFCTSPPRVNYAGKINLMCFDKTGTITEDDLSLQEVQKVKDDKFQDPTSDISNVSGRLLDIMASTHALSNVNGIFLGHPVDVRMFESTKWKIKDADAEKNKESLQLITSPDEKRTIKILRRFEFEPALQRMSVVVKIEKKVYLFTKGSPEAIRSLSESVPSNFEHVLREKAQQGVYVLGCGYKELSIKSKSVNELKRYNKSIYVIFRSEVETNLNFAGLLSFENKLKSDSTPTIKQLLNANIGVLMITGDNVHTAVTVGRKCGILNPKKRVVVAEVMEGGEIGYSDIDDPTKSFSQVSDFLMDKEYEVALTGKAIKQIFTKKDLHLIDRAKIFARTSPDQKAQICEHFVDEGYFVGMCGDGTNDCGALKSAHIGLALSEAEASVVSSFTSKKKVIGDVAMLIAEGRCALHTSFVAFKYMILYPIIQLISALRLYAAGSVLGDLQYLWTDVWLVLPLAVFMCWTGAKTKLSKRVPPSSLFHPKITLSLIGQVFFNIGGIVLMNVLLEKKSWYVRSTDLYPPAEDGAKLEDAVVCLENFTTFLWANFPYVITAIAFNNNTPFRKTFLTNIPFVISIIITFVTNLLLLVISGSDKLTALQIYPQGLGELDPPITNYPSIPYEYRWELFGWVILCLVLSILWEALVLEGPIANAFSRYWNARKRKSSKETPMTTFN